MGAAVAPTADTTTRRRFHFPALDGARALAVGAVLVFHLDADLASGGFVGVDVFFVLSGFLITGLLLQEHARTGQVRLPSFYARRALRLYPALIITCALNAVLLLSVFHTARNLAWSTFMSITYLTDFLMPATGHVGLMGHTWSLAVEEQFYLLWPLVLIWFARSRYMTAKTAALIAVCFGLAAALWPVQGADSYFMPWVHFTELLIGAAAAQLWLAGRLRVHGALAWPALAVIVAAAFLVPSTRWRPLYFGGWLILAACSVTVIAVLVTRPTHPLTRALASAPARWAGQRSYGIYLYSAPITFVFVDRDVFHRVSLNGAAMLSLTLGMAALSYRYVETPFLRLKHRFEAPATG